MRKKQLLHADDFFSFLLLLLLLTGPSILTTSTAQATGLKKKEVFSIGFNKEPILEVFSKIERISDLRFSYSREDMKKVVPITMAEKERNIIQLLKELSTKSGLNFNISKNLVAVLPRKDFDLEPEKKAIPVQKVKADTLIQGVVMDSLQRPLPGVSVYVKTKLGVGTSTDVNGRYSIKVPANSILVFKMVGYISVEKPANQPIVNVSLREDNSTLDEVQVVAFGTQKKESVVGAITTIKPSELKVPSSNLTTALSGRVAGMIAYQRSGEPGQDNAEFFIRGAATFGYKKEPLILIDGLELTATDLARLQPNDIASFSVLKDATSAAVYGARGANGIILVTTKRGYDGKAKINLEHNYSLSQPTQNIDLADPITFMRLHNEAISTRDPLGKLLYSQNKIDATAAGINPIVYPATDWMDLLLMKTTQNQRSNLSITGGGKVASYFVTGTMNKDNGIMKVDNRNNFNNNIKLSSYSLRSNVDVNITPTTQMAVRLYGNFDDYTGPVDGGTGVYKKIMNTNPVLFLPYYAPDAANQHTQHILFGNSETGGFLNPYADMVKGYKDSSRSLMLAQIEIKQDLSGFLFPGLKARLMASTQRRSYFDVQRTYNPFYYNLSNYDKSTNEYVLNVLNESSGTETLDYREGSKEISTSSYMETALNYDEVFGGKHAISGMLVGILRNSIAANSGSLQASLPFRNVGFSGRFSYGYNSRYTAELNFGYNGSERFSEDKRFGFFPSAGIAWNISNEAFWSGLKKIVSSFKLRATYGLIGNDAIGDQSDRFFYLSDVNLNNGDRGATFGQNFEYYRPGVSVNRYDNRNITWETARRLNLGFDLQIKDFNIAADYSTDKRESILMNRAFIPTTMGLSAGVRANVGEARSKAFESSVNYTKSFDNSFFVSATANFTYATNSYLKVEEPEYAEAYRTLVGRPLNQQEGYIAERLFIDEADIKNSPVQTFGTYLPGDIKYRDLNGDGQITPADRIGLGFPTSPEIVYGFGFSVGYKGFDFSSFFNGLGRTSFWITNYQTDGDLARNGDTSPFINDSRALLSAYANSHWSEDNRNLYALWPRLSTNNIANNSQTSTWFMRNGALLRLKQVELGYTFPTKMTSKFYIQKLRIYANGSNLLTFSKFTLWDPELGGNAFNYPVQRVFNFGVNVTF